jgi:hypothetical protein
LLLSTLFLPIIITLGVIVYTTLRYAPEGGLWIGQSLTLGVPTLWFIWALFALPLFLWFWILWSGNWRKPILTAGIVYTATFFIMVFELFENYTPPDKRMINIEHYGIVGADVYCNGVLLGQTPLKIRVDELIAKVPEWSTPPEQHWYDDAEPDKRLYTWFPWDDFRRERFEASKELFGANSNRKASNTPRANNARRELLNKHDAACRYWWSYRIGETQAAFVRNEYRSYYLNRPFDKISNYDYNFAGEALFPSLGFHVQLLLDVLPELTPEEKADWDRHVLKHWNLSGIALKNALGKTTKMYRDRDKNDPLVKLYENALHSTALLKYGLSDPPTEDECRRLLANWVAESASPKGGAFRSDGFYSSGEFSQDLSSPMVLPGILVPNNIHEPMRKALTEQWRKDKYRFDHGWSPVAYFSGQGKSPDYFADFARFSATTHDARLELLGNEAPGVAGLFKTLLHRRNNGDLLIRQYYCYAGKISLYAQVNNPLVETEMRNYIVQALSDPKHNDYSRNQVNGAVNSAIIWRSNRKEIDKEELSAWVASLPIPSSSKTLALQTLRLRRDEALTFADQLQKAAGKWTLIETELTLDDVIQWFADNPEGNLPKFLEEQEENITMSRDPDNYDRYEYRDRTRDGAPLPLPNLFIRALLRSDTSEGNPQVRDLVRKIWLNDPRLAEEVIADEYGYGAVYRQQRGYHVYEAGASNLPDYLLDLFIEAKQPQNWSLMRVLVLCDSPKALEILEKWKGGAPPAMQPQVERSLEIWRTRSALRKQKMEGFADLVAGRVVPDDLLFEQPPWEWKEGKYVQKN